MSETPMEADVVVVELLDFLLERADEKLHQHRHFLIGPAPVYAAEREQGEVLDTELDTALNGCAHSFDAAPVACHARQEAVLRPTSVAVHDYGDVAGHDPNFGDGEGRTGMPAHLVTPP